MDYEKKYKDAFERAKKFHEKELYAECNGNLVEYIFPELVESEDEKIRKWIINYLDNRILNSSITDEKKACSDAIAWLEKQDKQSIKWNKNTEGNKPQKNHSVLIKTTQGIAEGEWNGGKHWIQYRWSGSIKDSDVLFWIELSDIEEQGEQKPAEWSEDVEAAISLLKHIAEEQEKDYCPYNANNLRKAAQYLETCRPQNTWKPSTAQLNALSIVSKGNAPDDIGAIVSLYQDLKKLKD